MQTTAEERLYLGFHVNRILIFSQRRFRVMNTNGIIVISPESQYCDCLTQQEGQRC